MVSPAHSITPAFSACVKKLMALVRGKHSHLFSCSEHGSQDADADFWLVQLGGSCSADPCCAPLKVIVMSATMDVDQFSQYFSGAPVLYLEGRQHPIEIFYTKERQSDYLQAALVSIFQIHQVWMGVSLCSVGPGVGICAGMFDCQTPGLLGLLCCFIKLHLMLSICCCCWDLGLACPGWS